MFAIPIEFSRSSIYSFLLFISARLADRFQPDRGHSTFRLTNFPDCPKMQKIKNSSEYNTNYGGVNSALGASALGIYKFILKLYIKMS